MRLLICTSLLAVALPVGASLHARVALGGEEPPTAADTTTIEGLVKQLGADDFRQREAASKKLAELGEKARPALQRAAKESASPEVRWRADQLLQQLRGEDERPLGADDERPLPAGREDDLPPGGAAPPNPFGSGAKEDVERVRKLLEELEKRGGSAFRSLFPSRRIEAEGLVLDRLPTGQVRLRARRAGKPGEAEVADVFVGRSLAEILQANPELAELDGMDELKRRDAKQSWPGMDGFFKDGLPGIRVQPFPGGTGFGVSTSSGVSISQDANGVTVRITERDEDGEQQTKEYKGASMEEIKKQHPELADKLGGLSMGFRVGPPDFFWPGGQGRRRLQPLAPDPVAPPTTPDAADRALFGLGLQAPDEALASHLQLAPGMGAIVRQVHPGSPADALGLERNDIIVKVNGVAVDLDSAISALREAAVNTKELLLVELIRRGETLILRR